MEIDKTTQPSYVNIVIDDKKEYLQELREQAVEDGQEDNKLSITHENHSFNMEEMYFDEDDDELLISGGMKSPNGETYLYISIPISDTVLIDILEHALVKFTKLKNALKELN